MSNSTSTKYLRRHPKTGYYQYRFVVPPDLRGLIGRAEFTKSLKTREQAEAIRLLPPLLAETERKLKAARFEAEQVSPEANNERSTLTSSFNPPAGIAELDANGQLTMKGISALVKCWSHYAWINRLELNAKFLPLDDEKIESIIRICEYTENGFKSSNI